MARVLLCIRFFFQPLNNTQNLVLLHILKIASPVLLCYLLIPEIRHKQCFNFTDEERNNDIWQRYNHLAWIILKTHNEASNKLVRSRFSALRAGVFHGHSAGSNERTLTTTAELYIRNPHFIHNVHTSPNISFDTWLHTRTSTQRVQFWRLFSVAERNQDFKYKHWEKKREVKVW